MRHIVSLLVLGVMLAPLAPYPAVAQDLVEVEPIEEIIEEPVEVTEDVAQIIEEIIDEPEVPVESPEEVTEEVETPVEQKELVESSIEEPEEIIEEVVEEKVGEEFEAFSLLSAPEEDTATVVYDFPTGVWGDPNGAFADGNCRPYLPFGRTSADLGGAWEDIACEFSRWHDNDTAYEFDTLQTYLTTQNVNGTADYPLTAGTITVRIYETDPTWSTGTRTLVAESEGLDATTIAQSQTETVCSGTGTTANPYTPACLASFTFSDTVTLASDKYYVFEVAASDVVSPTQLFKGYYHYMNLAMVGASVLTTPFGIDGIQESPANNTGSVYMRLLLSEPELPRVLFLPGFLASRLYENDERQLWEPNGDDDLRDLALDDNGESQSPIYVGEVVDHGRPDGYPDLALFPIHENLFAWLNELQASEQIADWEAYSYDWRYDVFDILDYGTRREDGSRDYLTDIVESLAGDSTVTIIAHSNGGLLAKALMIRLEELGKEDLVDRIIFIGTPQVGTPQAMLGLLHGDDIFHPVLTFTGTARASAATMPGAYALLPSVAYFETPHSVLASFDTGSVTDTYIGSYGDILTDLVNTLAFWTNSPFTRDTPADPDEETPYQLSEALYQQAQETHTLLDAWVAPSGVEVYAIAGWGNETTTGATYVTECGLFSCSIDYEKMLASDGDDTVLAPSALFMGNATYFDLFELFDQFDERRKHQTLTESSFMHDYLEYLIGLHPNYNEAIFIADEPSAEKLNSGQTKVLSVHSPVIFNVTDSQGNQSGIFPLNDSDLYYILEGIPDSSVDVAGEDKYIAIPFDDEYEVTIAGIGEGTFTFQIEEYDGEERISDSSITDIPVTDGTFAYTTLNDDVAVASPLELDRDGDGTSETFTTFQENAAIAYEEPVPEEEEGEEGSNGNARRARSSSEEPGQEETPPEPTEIKLWPNPYLTPPLPFISSEQQQTAESGAAPNQPAETPQTAAVYDAIQASIAWLKNALSGFLSWILSVVGLT